MQGIVVARPAERGQSAGDGQISRIVFGNSDGPPGNFHGGRETTVQIKDPDIAQGKTGLFQAEPCCFGDCRRVVKTGTPDHMPDVVQLGASHGIDPPRTVYTQRLCIRFTGHDHGGRLIHIDVGHHLKGIGIDDIAVLVRGSREFLGPQCFPAPGMGILRRNP